MIRRPLLILLLSMLGATGALAQPAPVAVDGAWARSTLQGQVASAAYMGLVATEPLTLVGASSPAARVAEVHQMELDGDIMRMRAVDTLALPAGKRVEFKPGGHHLMLMGLKAPLQAGSTVPVRLEFRTAKGQARHLELAVPVTAQPPVPAKAPHKH
jgi:copper(I)-binding protein